MLMNRKQVIIFARAPSIGNGKRRLARDVGNRRAFQFYKSNLSRLIKDLRRGPWELHVAVTSEREKHHPEFRDLSVIVQPHGELGHRMSSVLSRFNRFSRIIVGSDIPALDRTHIGRAFRELSNHQLVFGPAVDGGFWGVGCSQRYMPGFHFMRDVQWSSSSSLVDTIATVKPGTSIAEIDALADVDDGESYRRCCGGQTTSTQLLSAVTKVLD